MQKCIDGNGFNYGSLVVYVNAAGEIDRQDWGNRTAPSSGVLVENYDTRFDDPSYYTA